MSQNFGRETNPATSPEYLQNSGLFSEHGRLSEFWNSRYREFSLGESGIKSLPPEYSRLLYDCKRLAYQKALSIGGVSKDARQVNILDGGCGQGFFAMVAHEIFRHPRYLGVDISDKAISFLKSRLPEDQWISANLSDATLRLGRKFEIAQSIEVLHLILDDGNQSQAIANLAFHLCQDGILIFTDTLPDKKYFANDYIVFRPVDYYKNLFQKLNLKLLAVFPMYYWIPDRGIASAKLRRISDHFPPKLMYILDRLFLFLGVPQLKQSHDSKMKMIVCKKLASQ